MTHSILTQRIPKSRYREEECVEDGIEYFERMPADKPTRLLALANEYDGVDCHEDEATVLERYAAAQVRNCSSTGSVVFGTPAHLQNACTFSHLVYSRSWILVSEKPLLLGSS